MNARGVFTFVIVLGFISVYLMFLHSANAGAENLSSAGRHALEMEKVNLVRSVLESNVDFLIEKTLESEFLSADKDPEKLKLKVNEKLIGFFNKIENSQPYSGIEINFYSGTFTKNQYSRILYSKNKVKLNAKFLNENSNVLVVNIKDSVYIAEYSFTGGILKNKVAYAVIASENFKQLFLIPIDYVKRVVVVL